MTTQPGLYIHLPFCLSRCGYCDFAVVTDRDGSQESYLDCLRNELAFWGPRLRSPLTTVYFGGGTPSRFHPDLFRRLLDAIRKACPLESDVEISAEANPESLSESLLDQWVGLGINRVSVGVQSFNDRLLPLLDRRHDAATAIRVLKMVASSNLKSWSLDLIYGLPGQSLPAWLHDLRTALDFRPPHISFYNLILHPNLPTTKRALSVLPPDHEDLQAIMFLEAVQAFEESGLEVYELSNAAKPGHYCRHNRLYWRGGEWIGIGMSASSWHEGRYFANPASWEAYLKAWPTVPKVLPVPAKIPDLEARLMDLVMLRLRTSEGVSFHEITEMLAGAPPSAGRDGAPASRRLGGKAVKNEASQRPALRLGQLGADLVTHGYAKDEAGYLALTPAGWLVHSEVTTRVMDCLLGRPG